MPKGQKFQQTVTDRSGWKKGCPCFNVSTADGSFVPCNKSFDLQDQLVYDGIVNFLSKALPEDQEIAQNFLADLNKKILSDRKNGGHRIFPICPKCNHKNTNEEAIRNSRGKNPLRAHPTDMTCSECNYNFCSDCLGEHYGYLCNGLRSDETPQVGTVACPGCRSQIYRTDGCTFMTCAVKECCRMFCWQCRCFRHSESSPEHHYCLTPERYQSNPDWRDALGIKVYISTSPPVPTYLAERD